MMHDRRNILVQHSRERILDRKAIQHTDTYRCFEQPWYVVGSIGMARADGPGWNAPKNSLLLVHPHGEGSKATNGELNISFEPTPDYAGIAKAAAGGDLWAIRASQAEDLERLLPEAIEKVKRGMPVVLDAHLNGSEGKYVGERNGQYNGLGKRGRTEE
jgi:hypothetical protein